MRATGLFASFALTLSAAAQDAPPPPPPFSFGDVLRMQWSHGTCTGSGPVRLTAPPMDPPDVGFIVPMGLMVDAHVTPIDHLYFYPLDFRNREKVYAVRAPAGGFIVLIQHRSGFIGDRDSGREISEFRVVIEHSCTFWVYYDLLTSLDQSIVDQLGAPVPKGFESVRVRVPVSAGQVIGRINGQSLDVGVVNSEVTLRGFVVPEHYAAEPWKIHTVDMFAAFDDPPRESLLALNLRLAEPRAGRIDLDVDGRLAGNWFREGTGGYRGTDRARPWSGHFSAAYNHLDPKFVILSAGDVSGASRQYGVKGNAPDPASISVESGVVSWELISVPIFLAFPNNAPPALAYNRDDRVLGVLLAQMLEDRKVRIEIFPGATAADKKEFTEAARIYER